MQNLNLLICEYSAFFGTKWYLYETITSLWSNFDFLCFFGDQNSAPRKYPRKEDYYQKNSIMGDLYKARKK